MTPEQAHALARAARAMQARGRAEKDLLNAVVKAKEAGCSLRQIAAALDITHAGVAKMLKRSD